MTEIKSTEKDDYITTSIYMPRGLRVELRRLSRELDTNTSQIVVSLIIDGLERRREKK